ncbi:hypothetical protein L1276_000207 [Flavobacterium sp. HSC-32F16]|uniref:hypothetical protein n=1 Tax=Flavobacterium sp. HSC-32F16 TaxID=2910964 RepID=UPI0020A26BF7|nr:hypothetical protein [Flavobacterium sp. HSC-32F16]MCP2025067.1 hypothetical protein [Flavobacterium sp. HSC-32F16]
MKKIILFICLVFSFNLWSQNLCRNQILPEEELFQKNELNKYSKYDFAKLWTQTDNNLIYGIIGDNYERILIKFISVKRNPEKNNEYIVAGKSMVNSNICDFTGKITITKVQEIKKMRFGVDDEYKTTGIKNQGLLLGSYEFDENKLQKGSGKFQGTIQSLWYLDKNDLIKYNNIESHSDKYFNNTFIGVWKSNNSGKEKICNWGDYRVPNVNCDFDIGAGELSISNKYQKNGWWIKPKSKWWL